MQKVQIIKPERVLKQKTVTTRNRLLSQQLVQPPAYDHEQARRQRQEQFIRSLEPKTQRTSQVKKDFERYGTIEKELKGQDVYLVAGGPSLKDFDFNRLSGKNVIAINKAFKYVTDFQYLYWTDSRFYNWFKTEIDLLKCKKFTPCTTPSSMPGNITILKNSGGRILDISSPAVITAGNNSGFGAISLAIKLGAARIYLLGYDLGFSGSSSHFHDGYPQGNTAKPSVYKSMLQYFEDNADIIKSVVEIYNTSKQSNLKCFDYCDIDTCL